MADYTGLAQILARPAGVEIKQNLANALSGMIQNIPRERRAQEEHDSKMKMSALAMERAGHENKIMQSEVAGRYLQAAMNMPDDQASVFYQETIYPYLSEIGLDEQDDGISPTYPGREGLTAMHKMSLDAQEYFASMAGDEKYSDLVNIPGYGLLQKNLRTNQAKQIAAPVSPAHVFNIGDKEETKQAGAQLALVREQAKSSEQILSSLAFAESALEGIETGKLAGIETGMLQWAHSMGFPVDKVKLGSMEAAQLTYSNMVSHALEAFSGSISEGERVFAVQKMTPSLLQTTVGRKLSTYFLKRGHERLLEKKIFTEDFFTKSGFKISHEGKTYEQAWNEHMEQNPIFDKRTMKVISATPKNSAEEKLQLILTPPVPVNVDEYLDVYKRNVGELPSWAK